MNTQIYTSDRLNEDHPQYDVLKKYVDDNCNISIPIDHFWFGDKDHNGSFVCLDRVGGEVWIAGDGQEERFKFKDLSTALRKMADMLEEKNAITEETKIEIIKDFRAWSGGHHPRTCTQADIDRYLDFMPLNFPTSAKDFLLSFLE